MSRQCLREHDGPRPREVRVSIALNAPAGSTFTVYYQTDRAMISTRCNGADIQASLGMTATSTPAMTAGYQPCLGNTANPDDLSERNSAATGWKVLSPTADAATLAKLEQVEGIGLPGTVTQVDGRNVFTPRFG